MCLIGKNFPSCLTLAYMIFTFFAIGFTNMAGVTIFPSILREELTQIYPNDSISNHDIIINRRISYAMGIRCLAHIFLTPLWGFLINKSGPLPYGIFGVIGEITSCVLMAFGRSFIVILISKFIEGVGSSSSVVAALTFISLNFKDFEERSCIIGLTSICIVCGNYASPFIAGLLYENYKNIGQMILYFFIVGLYLANIFCHCLIKCGVALHRKVDIENSNNSEKVKENIFRNPILNKIGSRDSLGLMMESEFVLHIPEVTPIYILLIDPYIDICIFGIISCHLPHYMLMSTLSVWLHKRYNVDETIQGLVWLPSFIFNLSTYIIGIYIMKKKPQYGYLYLIVSCGISVVSSIYLPYSKYWWHVMIPLGIFSINLTLVKFILLPLVLEISDSRHNSGHGSLAAIINESIQVAGLISFIGAGYIVNKYDFLTLNIIVAVIVIVFCPLNIFLKQFFHKLQN